MNEPAQGSIWLHTKSGNRYWVVCVAHREVDDIPCVVYRRVDAMDPKLHPEVSNKYWVRPLSEFLDRFEKKA